MKSLPSSPRANREYLTVQEFAAEAQMSVQAVAARIGRRRLAVRYAEWTNAYHRKGQVLIWVGDLPEECGSAYLIRHLESRAACVRVELLNLAEKIDRVMRHRRGRSVAA